ncbi:MAG: class I SAM-dependent methyltransferase [Isosphaeraceae bacterium]
MIRIASQPAVGIPAGDGEQEEGESQDRSHGWGQDRPRLLSYVGRWGRARRWLPKDAYRVLDVGCAFGYGTVAIMGHGEARRWVAGVERDPENVRLAGRAYPWLPMVQADATSLPFSNGTVDAVVILDVLEHLDDPAAVLAEVRRVLKRDGTLIVSVPHKGLLRAFDSNNLYTSLRRSCRGFLPLEPCEESFKGRHRHYSCAEAGELLGPGFSVNRLARTGIGFAELLHLLLLVVFKGLLRWRAAYMVLRHLYFAGSLLEDLIPAGPFGYNLTLQARAVQRDGRFADQDLSANSSMLCESRYEVSIP